MTLIVQVGRHTVTQTPLQTLARFLRNKPIYKTWHIFHPLRHGGITTSCLYSGRTLLYQHREWKFEYFQYIWEFLYTFYFLLFHIRNIDVYVGMSGFDMLPAVLLQKLSKAKIKKLIFYPIDYTDERFPNRFLNGLYEIIDRLSVRASDIIVYTNQRVKAIRQKQGASSEQLLFIPNGLFLGDLPHRRKLRNTPYNTLYYVGYLDECHGVEDIVKAFGSIAKTIPQVKLEIIGTGPQKILLQKYIEKNNLHKQIKLLGKLSNKQVLHILSRGGIGLAPYTLYSRWVYYCDPIKVKEYLACGLPVIISNVVEVAENVKRYNCGLIYQNMRSLVESIKKLTTDHKMYKYMSKNTFDIANSFDYEKNYTELFARI